MQTGINTLTYPTINGLKSLNLDELTTGTINTNEIVSNNIDGNYFSIDTIEASDIQVDNELELTNSGFIIVGKGTQTEVIITDDEVKFLAGITSNIQSQIDNIDGVASSIVTDIATNTANILINTTATQNLTSDSTNSIISNVTFSIKDSPEDTTITNSINTFDTFDKCLALMRSNNDYRKYFIGLLGDGTNATNDLSFACNGNGGNDPEILMNLTNEGNLQIKGVFESTQLLINGETQNNSFTNEDHNKLSYFNDDIVNNFIINSDDQ
jgi:hypothetical protein